MTTREYDYEKRRRTPLWTSDKGLSPGQVKLLDALLLGPSKKEAAKRLGISPCTVGDTLKVLFKRYNLHNITDLMMWWALWLACYSTIHNRNIPLLPHQIWPFSERKLK
jgi:DNA-binding NarL/FixJ family response regulator